MRMLCLGTLVTVVLGVPVRAADGQRLAPGFPVSEASLFISNGGLSRAAFRLSSQPRECSLSPVLRVATGGLAGAAGGWLAYEISLGIWVSGEGATPDATLRRIRSTAIVTGAILGVVMAVQTSRRCSAAGA